MADSDFWRDLAATFLLVPGHEMTRVDLQYAIGSEAWQWRLAGSPDEFIDNTFKRLAKTGAYEIAPKGTTDFVGAWLEAIRKQGINFHQREGPKGYVSGHIDRVFEASAILCGKLEDQAMQTEREEKHRNDPANRSPLPASPPEPISEPTSPEEQPEGVTPEPSAAKEKPRKRLSATIHCPAAARKMETYLEVHGIGLTEFATKVGTTDRTLRSFRKTGKIKRDIFEEIAKAMGMTKESLLKA